MQQSGQGYDFTGQVSKVRKRARPWQAIITLLLAIGAAVAVHLRGLPPPPEHANITQQIITACGTVAFCVFGLVATFGFARRAKALLAPVIGIDYSAIVRFVLVLLGVIIVALTALSLLHIDLSKLILGGAITGVLLSIAAQQSLANLFAGVMLQIARPFTVGDRVRVRSGALAGTIEGTVMDFTITYIRLDTDEGRVFLPNSQVLAAAVSPLPRNDLVRPEDGAPGSDAWHRAETPRPADTAPSAQPEVAADAVRGAEAVVAADAIREAEPGHPADNSRGADTGRAADGASGADGAHGNGLGHEAGPGQPASPGQQAESAESASRSDQK